MIYIVFCIYYCDNLIYYLGISVIITGMGLNTGMDQNGSGIFILVVVVVVVVVVVAAVLVVVVEVVVVVVILVV